MIMISPIDEEMNSLDSIDSFSAELEGTIIVERFLIEKKLDKGGYGSVFKAIDLHDNTSVAVKIAFGVGKHMQKNMTEVEILDILNRTGSDVVVKMKTHYIFDDCVVIVLELLSHNLWNVIMNMNSNNLKQISFYAKQMLEFLSFFLSTNLIHGDIKPENILIGDNQNKLKLIDFGLTQPLSKHDKWGEMQSLNYRAPEVLLGLDYTSSADVWSLGCIFMECLIRDSFFTAENNVEYLNMITNVFGYIDTKSILKSPKKDNLFYFDDFYMSWTVKDSVWKTKPQGLLGYVMTVHPEIIVNQDCLLFLDLIEGMMRLHPEERYTPEMCLRHQFFQQFIEK